MKREAGVRGWMVALLGTAALGGLTTAWERLPLWFLWLALALAVVAVAGLAWLSLSGRLDG